MPGDLANLISAKIKEPERGPKERQKNEKRKVKEQVSGDFSVSAVFPYHLIFLRPQLFVITKQMQYNMNNFF